MFWLFWRLVHCWYSLGRRVTIGTPMVIFAVLTVFWLFLTIGTVYHSPKTAKDSQTAKMTIGVPVVTCLHRVRRIQKAAQTPLPCETCITCARAVATARRPWAGLNVCVWLPFAAACCSTLFYLLMMPAARLVCQRPSSNFTYFWTPLANFLLSRPNSVEYGNSKTTTLLYSAKCTRPLFKGRTGCGGCPFGWHDIVTCQRLVIIEF